MRNALVLAALVAAALSLGAGPAMADSVRLRTPVETSGTAVTLGDFFTDIGPAAARAVGPAPAPGRTALFSARFVKAAAASAGIDWSPPDGLTTIQVTRIGGGASSAQAFVTQASSTNVGAVIHRNALILIVYSSPGVKITMRGRALNDAAVGEPVRVVNLSSNRTVEAIVTGEGAAAINTAGN